MSGKKSAPPSSRPSTGTTGKKRALPELSLVDDSGPAMLPGKAYNPYDRDPKNLGKSKKAAASKPDLRKLSQWIKLKREVDELKKEPPEEE